ncbi:MFS transporter [Streptomyces sp. B1866]|uniref:MFS transporter n=1 Tax=Streptomyces sp. B1866 TaxID=3075431 RepID=UPI00288F309D|nr:MFS transporter [Streptomyces sp. B1866]MDT3397105.1 MFS transporter [Streptomyces sp. B1866]
MAGKGSPGRAFRWLWAAYAVSTYGTWFAFDAFPLIAILALDAGPAEVAALAATGLAVGAAVAVPLGAWVEFRRKRPVMAAMDLVRFAALASVCAAYALGRLGLVQLLAVSAVVAAADITFNAASGACLKALVRPEDLLAANGRLEATTWTATVLGPPLGGAATGALGPVPTVAANAVSFLLSAAGIRAIGGREPRPARADARPAPAQADARPAPARAEEARPARGGEPPAPTRVDAPSDPARAGAPRRRRGGGLLDGWRFILADPALRPLFFNTVLVNGLIMAASPPLAVLMVGRLGFAPWSYGLAFAVPCLGGLVGSRLAPRLVARFGRRTVLLTAGALRAGWPLGLAFVRPGPVGLVLVMAVELGLITCAGVFNPVYATYRLDRTPADRVTRTLTAWSVTGKAATAALTALWGLLAGLAGARAAIALAGLLLLATPLLLPWRDGGTPRADPLRADRASREGVSPPPPRTG